MGDREFSAALQLFQRKDYISAVEKLLALRLPESKHSLQSYYVGLCFIHLRDYEKALVYLTNALASPENFIYEYQGRMIIGYVYAVTNRHELAIREFNQLLMDGYESAKVYAALAHSLYHQGETRASIEKLEKALEIDPENATALNSLGFILTESGGDLQRAVDCCQKAVAQQPYNPAYLDSLAMAYYRQEKMEESVNLLQQAYKLSGENEQILQHIQMVMNRG